MEQHVLDIVYRKKVYPKPDHTTGVLLMLEVWEKFPDGKRRLLRTMGSYFVSKKQHKEAS